jgi:hypothetical protein
MEIHAFLRQNTNSMKKNLSMNKMQKQFQHVLPGNDCYSTTADLGYQGVKTFEQISQICAANPNCKGFRGNIDWWLLSQVANTGPQSENRKCYQAVTTCIRPQGWCSHPGSVYKNVDRVGDGVMGDHICLDDKGNTGTILRTNNCQSLWPNAALKKASTPCTRPQGWCYHPGAVYKNLDLLGDGVNGDHICIDRQGQTGRISRDNDCKPIWPNANI